MQKHLRASLSVGGRTATLQNPPVPREEIIPPDDKQICIPTMDSKWSSDIPPVEIRGSTIKDYVGDHDDGTGKKRVLILIGQPRGGKL